MDLAERLFHLHPDAANVADSPSSFISAILPNVYVIAGLILFLYLVFGGFMIVSAAGSQEQAQQGQQAITNAIMGFVVIFSSYWIIQVIEVISGIPILSGGVL